VARTVSTETKEVLRGLTLGCTVTLLVVIIGLVLGT
jgi:hypothetical protein